LAVSLAPNPRYEAFAAILRKHRPSLRPWRGDGFRSVSLRYARSDKLIDGQGAYQHGSRWSAPGAFRCVNLSTAADTAWRESHALASYYGLKESILQPRVLAGVQLKLLRVLNLLENAALARALASPEILAEDWRQMNDNGRESLGQALGRAAHHLGTEALLVPSAQVKGGGNIVVFPESLRALSRMQVIGDEELDQWLKKS
jgi:RES domain-containing protein